MCRVVHLSFVIVSDGRLSTVKPRSEIDGGVDILRFNHESTQHYTSTELSIGRYQLGLKPLFLLIPADRIAWFKF